MSISFNTVKKAYTTPTSNEEVCGVCHKPMFGEGIEEKVSNIVGHHIQNSKAPSQTHAIDEKGKKLQHLFHKACIQPRLDMKNPSCPLCREPVWDGKTVHYLRPETGGEVVVDIHEEREDTVRSDQRDRCRRIANCVCAELIKCACAGVVVGGFTAIIVATTP